MQSPHSLAIFSGQFQLSKKALFLILLLYSFLSCKKEDDVIPYIYVDLYIYTSEPSFVNLNAVGGWVYVSGGSRGIIIYRKTNDEFVALDRHCTYEPSNSCATVEVDSSNVMAVDNCCGSKFQLIDGAAINGPATVPLKQYHTSFDGSVLHVFN